MDKRIVEGHEVVALPMPRGHLFVEVIDAAIFRLTGQYRLYHNPTPEE